MSAEQDTSSLYDQVYKNINSLNDEDRTVLLKKLISPQELFLSVDGTKFAVHTYGLRLFETKGLLSDIGIPEDDPRASIYRKLVGTKIDVQAPNKLRAISAKEATRAKNTGAIEIWNEGKKVWWVPISATSQFVAEMETLQVEFEQCVQTNLIDRYDELLRTSRMRFEDAARQAWEDMSDLGRVKVSQDTYINASMQTFDKRFPTRDEILSKIRMEIEPVGRPLPTEIEDLLIDIRTAERSRLAAETAAFRATEAVQSTQLRMMDIECRIKETELIDAESERKLRREIISEQLGPEIDQAKQVVLQVQSSLMRVATEIIEASKTGAKITPATKKSWNLRLARLKDLSPENPDFEQALDALEQMSNKEDVDFERTQKQISRALNEMERTAATEIRADAIWQLIQAGRAEDALQSLGNIRGTLSDRLLEVESLQEMVFTVGARTMLDTEEATTT